MACKTGAQACGQFGPSKGNRCSGMWAIWAQQGQQVLRHVGDLGPARATGAQACGQFGPSKSNRCSGMWASWAQQGQLVLRHVGDLGPARVTGAQACGRFGPSRARGRCDDAMRDAASDVMDEGQGLRR